MIRSSYARALRIAAIAVICTSIAGQMAGAEQKADAQDPSLIPLSAPGAPLELMLRIEPLQREEQLMFFVGSLSKDGCKYAEGFEVPVQINETSFQLKRMLRANQRREPDGSCSEAIATIYWFNDFRLLKNADSLVLHFPTGAVSLSKDALAYIKSIDTGSAPPAERVDPDRYIAAVNLLNDLIRKGRTKEALDGAELVAHLFASRPAPEGLAFFATYGMVRRKNDDLVGAALCYETAIMLASASRDTTENVGVVYDNLATVRRLQQRFDDATAASDRALAIFEQRLGARHGTYGGALSNRALIHLGAGNAPLALEYSERALSVLREALSGDKAALEPFLADNRLISAKLPRQ